MKADVEKDDAFVSLHVESSATPLSEAVEKKLVAVLERYLADLENGCRPDAEALIAEYPSLAEPLRECLVGLDYLHDAIDGCELGQVGSSQPNVDSPKQLGDYEIVREIGRGGMGVVYEARQISLDRRVALKVLPFSAVLDQKQVARFENEARAAAHLHHPNIVPVFSVGCERGIHYYSMQYIEGRPLNYAIREIARRGNTVSTQQATRTEGGTSSLPSVETSEPDAECLPLTDRSRTGTRHFRTVAELGIQAAEALHHAHECGIVHRDVKPSNLLLDLQGNLWVADFGLARCGANPSLTSTGGLLGTIKYMSPEQAAGKHALVDHRTDVYSLGITLYELSTLRDAFPGKDRQLVLRRIIQDDPPSPRKLRPSIPIDLETIILKATAKSREQRYETAQELAEDLQRFVQGEPIRARRASIADRMRKWAVRHKTIVRSALIVVALAVIMHTVATFRIADALRESEVQRGNAVQWYGQVRHVLDHLAKRHAQRLKDYPEMEELRQELLSEVVRYYEEFLREVDDESGLRRDLALTWFRLGKLLEEVPNLPEAQDAYETAQRLLEKQSAETPEDPEILADLALCRNNLGCLLSESGNASEARMAYQAAIAVQQRLASDFPEADRYRFELALTQGNLAALDRGAGQCSEAEQSYRSALALCKELVRRHPQDPKYRRQLAMAHNDLGIVLSRLTPEEAEESYREALIVLKALVASHPDERENHADLALCYSNLGALKKHLGQLADSQALYRAAIENYEILLQSVSVPRRYQCELATAHSNLGAVHIQADEYEAACRAFQNARDLLELLIRQVPECLHYRSLLGGVMNNQATALAKIGRQEEAELAYREGIEHQRFVVDHAPQVSEFRRLLADQRLIFDRFLQEKSAAQGR